MRNTEYELHTTYAVQLFLTHALREFLELFASHFVLFVKFVGRFWATA